MPETSIVRVSAYNLDMKQSLTAATTALCIALASCERQDGPPPVGGVSPNLLTTNVPTALLSLLKVPTAAAQRRPSVSNIQAAMLEISRAQEELFKKTGKWLSKDSIQELNGLIFNTVSQEVLGHPYHKKDDSGREFFSALNAKGYHLFPGLTSVEGEVYLGVTLFALGEPKDSAELADMKRVLGMTDSQAKMRELIPVAATRNHDTVYGSPGHDGIYVNVRLLLQDQTAGERSTKGMFQALLANELGHLKLRAAVEQGRVPQPDNQVEEAYSDYWSLIVTTPQEIIFGFLDVLQAEPLRYQLSKECAMAGAVEFGRVHLPGFGPKMDEDSASRLVGYINDSQNVGTLLDFKQALLNNYKRVLIERGNIPAQMF